MNTGPIRSASGRSISRRLGNSSAASRTRACTRGSARSSQATPTSSSSSESSGARLVAVDQHLQHLLARADRACHRPGVIEAGRERKDTVERDEPVARLEADDPAARGRDPDRAAGVRAERVLGEPRRDRGRRASARPSGHAPRIPRVRHRPEVRVDGRDPVRELVQVRLADVRIARRLESRHRLRAALRHVVRVDDRPVGSSCRRSRTRPPRGASPPRRCAPERAPRR